MYSKEQKEIAIQLYIKYNKRIAPVIRELGYPSRQLLPLWYKEYKNEQEGLFKSFVKKNKYTKEERDFAIQHYLSHGKILRILLERLVTLLEIYCLCG